MRVPQQDAGRCARAGEHRRPTRGERCRWIGRTPRATKTLGGLAVWSALSVVSSFVLPSLASAQSPASGPPAAPHLVAPPAGGVEEAPEGHLLARWEPAAGETSPETSSGARYEVQVSRQPGFDPAHTVEAGADRASFLSGLRNGDTYVRVRALSAEGEAGSWSPAGTVRVSYPAQSLVRNLLVLGSLTFAVLLVAIFLGVRRTTVTRQEGSQ